MAAPRAFESMRPTFNQVSDWTSWDNQGPNIALANLGKNGQPDLVVLRVDHPTPGPSRGFYRIAARLTPYRQIGSTQRLVDVPFTTTPPDALNAMIPNDRNLAPPG
jgi:hypothetical protein